MTATKNHNGPAFICVGPHKTGTSWLHSTLGKHKAVEKCAVKEVNYFFYKERRRKNKRLRTQLSLLFIKPRRKIFLKRLKKVIKGILTRDKRLPVFKKQFEYEYRWILGLFSDKFYRSLFSGSQLMIGDISPKYFYLDKKSIAEIKTQYPDMKVLIFLREPIDRLWSHVKMYFKNNAVSKTEENIFKVTAMLQKHELEYPDEGFQNWTSIFDANQLFIGYYNELQSNPVKFYKSVCKFLGISDDIESQVEYEGTFRMSHHEKGTKKIEMNSAAELISFKYNHSAIDLEMPKKLRDELISYYYPKVENLHRLTHHKALEEWIDNYKLMQLKDNTFQYL